MLALVTGLIALGLYYYGLQSTPAVAATIAELAFPVSATLVGYFKFGYVLTGWQWVGVALTTLVVALLPARSERIERVPVPAPAPAPRLVIAAPPGCRGPRPPATAAAATACATLGATLRSKTLGTM